MFQLIAPALLRSENALAAGLLGGVCVLYAVIIIAVVVFPIYCFWRICVKAGYPGPMALLSLIPMVGMLILMCILAFGTWPNQR
ncbi:MAG: hypothetical protein FWG02_01355 [Holophagaceae bacterium]|nr:hypothetical protein [Holophagaceae bacterium]